jgi:hypothetical protein
MIWFSFRRVRRAVTRHHGHSGGSSKKQDAAESQPQSFGEYVSVLARAAIGLGILAFAGYIVINTLLNTQF